MGKFKCKICGKSYSHKNDLVVHMLKHDSTIKKTCGVCPKIYIQLNDHYTLLIRKVHGKNTEYILIYSELLNKLFKIIGFAQDSISMKNAVLLRKGPLLNCGIRNIFSILNIMISK